MYSGEESSGDALNSAGQFGNWPISSTTCNNMSQEQVDWAALAQQWIQMKESTSLFVPMPPPPPAGMPSISYEEKGEEDMEVVKEDDLSFNSGVGEQELHNNPNPIYRSPPEWQPSWYSEQSQWRPGWNNWPNGSSHSINVSEINAPPAPSMTILKGTAAIVNNKPPSSEPTPDSIPTMDAAKRKTLPAWIREGLEKMEKEKLKQLEKQKEIESPKNAIDLINKELNVSPERLSNDIIKIKSDKSFQESDQSDEDGDAIEAPVIQEIIQATSIDKPAAVIKTREEWLEEWMLIVRRSLTEVLLEVTNEEILNVAQETIRKNKIKASSAQVFRKSAISSITGKLGLGAYADSASENSESEDENDEDDSDQDSEEEIKESIRNRQIAFKSVAQEIELSAMEADLREQRRNAEHAAEQLQTKTTKKGYDKDTGETQPDKKSQSNGKRSRERTSRFSDAKDSKHRNSTYAIIHTAALPSSSSEFDKRKTSNSTTTSTTTTNNNNTASSSSRTKNYSDSSDSTSSSSDSYRRRKYRRTRDRNHKSSSSRRETSRASSDSDDYSRRSKKYRSSYSRDRSRSRSRSRSYTGKSRY